MVATLIACTPSAQQTSHIGKPQLRPAGTEVTFKQAREAAPFPIPTPKGWSERNDIDRVLINFPGKQHFEAAIVFDDGSHFSWVMRREARHLEPIHAGDAPGTVAYIIDLNGNRALVREPGENEALRGDPSTLTPYPGVVNWFEGTVEITLFGYHPGEELIRVARSVARAPR